MLFELQRENQEDREVNGVQPASNSSDINLNPKLRNYLM